MIEQAWLHLLEEGGADERLVETAAEEARAASTVALPTSLSPAMRAALGGPQAPRPI